MNENSAMIFLDNQWLWPRKNNPNPQQNRLEYLFYLSELELNLVDPDLGISPKTGIGKSCLDTHRLPPGCGMKCKAFVLIPCMISMDALSPPFKMDSKYQYFYLVEDSLSEDFIYFVL